MVDTSALRRRPTQRRAADTLDLVLSSAAQLLDEVGYEALSTGAVAERAGVAVGTVYRYARDRRSLAKALAQRNLERYTLRLVPALEALPSPRGWWAITEVAIDTYIAMHREEPGFAFLRFGDVVDVLLLDGETTNNTVLADGLLALGTELAGLEDTPELRFAVQVTTEIVDVLLKRAFLLARDGDPALLTEAKRLARLRLGEVLEHPA